MRYKKCNYWKKIWTPNNGNEAIKYYTIIYVGPFLFMVGAVFYTPSSLSLIHTLKIPLVGFCFFFCIFVDQQKAIMIYLLFFACDSVFRVINLQEHIFNVACYDMYLCISNIYQKHSNEKKYLFIWQIDAAHSNSTSNKYHN